jgi:N-dimethylarginine dimethylaminohydrolase
MSSNNQIVVNHEWGALKEVIVGSPYFYIPTEFPEYMRPWLSELGIERFTKTCGGTIKESLPEVWQEQEAQINSAIDALEKRGIKVHQVLEPTDEEVRYLGFDQFLRLTMYPRDEIVVIGNNYIETSLQNPGRRSTRWAIRRTVGDRLENSDAQIVSMLEPPPTGEGIFLESGDVFLMGHDILVGRSGNGSNAAGAKWLQRYLGEEYRIHEMPFSNDFLHLDCVLCTPRPGLAMICREAFPDGIPSFFKDWDLIDVSVEDANQKSGTNHLVVDEKTIMVPAELPNLSEALTKAGQEVIEIPFSSMIWQGGSFRCWHHPLVRESSL